MGDRPDPAQVHNQNNNQQDSVMMQSLPLMLELRVRVRVRVLSLATHAGAPQVRRMNVHILIDLNGHSAGAVPSLIMQRGEEHLDWIECDMDGAGAPVQLQWLGCASPSGRPKAVDALVLDSVSPTNTLALR